MIFSFAFLTAFDGIALFLDFFIFLLCCVFCVCNIGTVDRGFVSVFMFVGLFCDKCVCFINALLLPVFEVFFLSESSVK